MIIPQRRRGLNREGDDEGDRFARYWIAYSFKRASPATRALVERELLADTRKRGRPPNRSLALQGYAAGLFSTCGMTLGELHTAFLEIGWAQMDKRDWWRDARRAIEGLQQWIVDREGTPPPLLRGPLPPGSQRIRRPGFALVVDADRTGELDGEPLSIVTSVEVKPEPTHRPEGEARGEDWAVGWAVERLRSEAKPHWVADLFARSSVCRGVAVEAMVAWHQARAVKVANARQGDRVAQAVRLDVVGQRRVA